MIRAGLDLINSFLHDEHRLLLIEEDLLFENHIAAREMMTMNKFVRPSNARKLRTHRRKLLS